MTKFNTRLHLIVKATEAAAIEAELDKISPGLVRFVPSDLVKPTRVVASGQWTAAQAVAIVAALAGWPAAVVARGFADGAEAAGAVEVKPGDDDSKVPQGKARKSFERAVDERAEIKK